MNATAWTFPVYSAAWLLERGRVSPFENSWQAERVLWLQGQSCCELRNDVKALILILRLSVILFCKFNPLRQLIRLQCIIIIIIIIITITIIIISFMQGIYTYIPETNHVPREYSVSALLSLLFMVSISLVPALALLYFYVSTFRSMCAVPNMAVFCSSFT